MPRAKKETTKDLQKRLMKKSVHVCDTLSSKETKELEALRKAYKTFISTCKTEREAAAELVKMAKKAGFVDVAKAKPGQKFYRLYKNKAVGLAIPGKQSAEQGVNLVISHLDAPRLDLKQNPLYEDCNVALAKTHYYGGIKKFQWVVRPMALHGVAITSKGKSVPVVIGEKDDDPVFTILDLLPHLAGQAQSNKKLGEAIIGEKLNVVMGGMPFGNDKDKHRFKTSVLDALNKNYGLVEEDLVSAEFEVVPAGPARDVGLDRGFVGGYGHDDRVSAFSSVYGILDAKPAKRAQVVICVDKEEIGSVGNTGARGRFVLDFLGDLLDLEKKPSERAIRKSIANSKVLSADVSAAVNPDWQEVHEKNNAAYTGQGIVVMKFTGVRGKGGASDANAEYLGEVRNLFNANKVVWQSAELGKVDAGGGGTVAQFLTDHGADVLDCGVGVLAMHSPFEIIHVGDLFMAWRAYKAFLAKA